MTELQHAFCFVTLALLSFCMFLKSVKMAELDGLNADGKAAQCTGSFECGESGHPADPPCHPQLAPEVRLLGVTPSKVPYLPQPPKEAPQACWGCSCP